MKKLRKVIGRLIIAVSALLILLQPAAAHAATLSNGSLSLSNTRTAADASTYTFTWSNVSTAPMKCLKISFNTQANGGGSEPTGMDVSTAAVDATSTYNPSISSWTVAEASGVVSVTDGTGDTPANASGRTVVLTGVTNPSVADTNFYAIFNTYNNTDCTTSPVDNGNVTFKVVAGQLNTASMGISDPRPLASPVSYTFKASGVALSTIKCIEEVFATTATGSTVPPDLSTSGASVNVGATNYVPTPASWTADGSTTNGTIKITDAGGEIPGGAGPNSLVLDGITNGSIQEVGYFVRVTTYSDAACTTGPIDQTIVMFIYENGEEVSVDVDPSLSFVVTQNNTGCNGASVTTSPWTTPNLVYLGHPTVSTNVIGAQDLTISTNAVNGFTVFGRYDHTLYNQNAPTPASVTISDATGTNAAPQSGMAAGTEAYGYTTNDSTLQNGTPDRFTSGGGNKWAKWTTGNLEVAYNGGPAGNTTNIGGGTNNTVCLGYQVGINGVTEAGHYTDTVFLTATPVY